MNKTPIEMGKDKKLEKFGEGPWLLEPDYLEFEYRGINCLIRRNQLAGNLCGYCQIPKGHPNYKKVDQYFGYRVHGGITYDEFDKENNEHWIGFDCAHCDDYSPYYKKDGRMTDPYSTYKSIEYVMSNCQNLATQILEENEQYTWLYSTMEFNMNDDDELESINIEAINLQTEERFCFEFPADCLDLCVKKNIRKQKI
jgi:hypothetical protein